RQRFAPRLTFAWGAIDLRPPFGKFGEVPVRHIFRIDLLGEAVPDLLNELQALPDAELIDPQRFDTNGHGRFLLRFVAPDRIPRPRTGEKPIKEEPDTGAPKLPSKPYLRWATPPSPMGRA